MVLYYVDDSSNKNIIKNKFYTYKEAFLQPEQHDVKVLIGLLRCYKYLLLTPIDFDEVNRRFGKYLSIFLSLVCAVYCCFSIKSSYGSLRDSPITHFLLTALFCITNVLFLITCFLNANTFKQENWKVVLNCIDQAEYMLRKLNFRTSKKNFLLFLQVSFVFVPYLALTIFHILIWIHVGDLTTIYIHVGSCMTYFSMCLFLIFMIRLTGTLKTRYDFVEDTLRRIATGRMDDQEKMKRLSEMFRLYKIFIILVDNLNDIFGWHLFLYVSVSISYTLFAVSYNMKINTDDELEKKLSISSIVITIIYIVSSFSYTFCFFYAVFVQGNIF